MQPQEVNSVPEPRKEFNLWLLFAVAQLLAALACLIQWGKPSPWARVDFFSGGYLFLRALPVLRSLITPFRQPVSRESQRERFGLTSGRGVLGISVALSIVDLAVYMDYGHWNLTPGLQWPPLQAFGLLLHLTVAVCNRWTSRYLRAAFANNSVRPTLMRSGPYAYIRHPTYAGAMIQRVAEPLVFGSVVAWVLAVFWWVLLLRQVQLEEVHMRKLFSQEYEDYARQTARLMPGVF
jgi:protein-S-isoprenylcysteine O-methyltransferase Ste14